MIIAGSFDTNGQAVVRVDGRVLNPARSQRVRNHSPCGFAWGYGGSGPAQLALAVLLRAGLTVEQAQHHYQAFKWEFISVLPVGLPFVLELDVARWVRQHEQQAVQ